MTLIGVASGDWHYKDGRTIWGGSGWARIGQYIPHLTQFDWVVGTLVWDNDHFKITDENEADHIPDLVFLHRLMHKGLHEHVRLARAAGQVVVNDLDDWYWGLDSSNQAFLASHPKYNQHEDRYSYRKTLAASDLLVVSTPYLSSRIADVVKTKIIVVENTVEVDRFTPIEMTDSMVPVVGWVGSTNHRSSDLETMRGILSPMWVRKEIRLQHSGYHPNMRSYAEAIGVPEAAVEIKLPLASHDDYPAMMTMDVGIVPLRHTPFNQAKSYIKGLEYAAAGIPFVAQSIDAYDQLRTQYGFGITARKASEWIKMLRRMRDPLFRAEESAKNRELVVQRDISVGVKDMADVLSGALG